MSQRVFLRHLVRHTPRVAFSRLRKGPGRPSWSFGFELSFAGVFSHCARAIDDVGAFVRSVT